MMRASEASEKKKSSDYVSIRFIQEFFLQNTKFGVRVPFALLLAYRAGPSSGFEKWYGH